MSAEQKITDLLYWIRDLGVAPRHPSRRDQFLNPYTNRIVYFHPKRAHLLPHLLWIPNEAGVKKHLPQLRLEDASELKLATVGGFLGAGPGESEALLSLFNSFRAALPA